MRASSPLLSCSFLILGLSCAVVPAAYTQSASPTPTLTLEEAIHLGLAHHPASKLADSNASKAEAALSSARAMALPAVSASEEAIVSTDPVFAFGTKLRQAKFSMADFDVQSLNHPSAIGNFASTASAHWTAFDFGVTQGRIRGAREAVQAAQAGRDFTDQQIADAVTTLYYRALLAESQVSTAQENLTRTKEVAADARDRVRSGLALESDGLRADVSARNAEDDLAAANSNVLVARQDLFDAIGQPGTNAILTVPSDTDTSAPSATGLTSRLDLKALDLQRASEQHNFASIHASARPSLSTYAQVQSDNPHFTGGGSGNWTVGAKLEITVFDGGVRRAREQEASAQIAKLTAQRAQTELEAKSRMRVLVAEVQNLNRRKSTATETIHAGEEGLKTARDRYAAGLAPLSEVLTEEAELSAAEFDLVRTTYQLHIAHTELEFTTGALMISKAGQLQ